MSVWREAEIRTLIRMRDGFLKGTAGMADYWESAEALDLYDRTFARRIGWKWDAVLEELRRQHWTPASKHLIDWGCGSGIASRSVLSEWADFESVTLSDRSALARGFAAERLRKLSAAPAIHLAAPHSVDCSGGTVLLSHVLSELDEPQLAALLRQLETAATILWVESATHENARRLGAQVREPLLGRGGWNVVAPCTHRHSCPLLEPANARHWCHQFARVPSEVHQDGAWRELSMKLGIDLRSLPYTYLVLEKQGIREAGAPVGLFRRIGEAREFKGYMKVLSCGEAGAEDLLLQKRDAPAAFKRLAKGGASSLHSWVILDGRIVGETDSGRESE